MAENQGEAEAAGQGAPQREAHRRPPRRCGERSAFAGVAKSFRTPSSDRFHWYVLAELEEIDCIVEPFDDEPGPEGA